MNEQGFYPKTHRSAVKNAGTDGYVSTSSLPPLIPPRGHV